MTKSVYTRPHALVPKLLAKNWELVNKDFMNASGCNARPPRLASPASPDPGTTGLGWKKARFCILFLCFAFVSVVYRGFFSAHSWFLEPSTSHGRSRKKAVFSKAETERMRSRVGVDRMETHSRSQSLWSLVLNSFLTSVMTSAQGRCVHRLRQCIKLITRSWWSQTLSASKGSYRACEKSKKSRLFC